MKDAQKRTKKTSKTTQTRTQSARKSAAAGRPGRRTKPPQPKSSRLLWIPIALLFAAFLGLAFEIFVPYGPTRETFVDIPAHTGTTGIAADLEQGGIVRNRWIFTLLREVRGGSLKAGEYRFDHPTSMLEVYSRVRRGDVFTIAVVVPEGFNLFDIAQAVETAGLCPHQNFLAAAAANTRLIRAWDPSAKSLEGYLFPDTYRFSRHTTPEIMLATMTHRFGQMALRLGLAGPDVPRVVTMASLVEREVHVDAERPVVAGVFENRLRAGMPLQTDPAVVYASMLRGTWTGVIHQSELHSDSAYNTYTHTGLPPGPICNPGVAALSAAMHPTATDYMYFVANPDGSTNFARSLREHNENVAQYRRGLDRATK